MKIYARELKTGDIVPAKCRSRLCNGKHIVVCRHVHPNPSLLVEIYILHECDKTGSMELSLQDGFAKIELLGERKV